MDGVMSRHSMWAMESRRRSLSALSTEGRLCLMSKISEACGTPELCSLVAVT
jgi:hypothetical protein